MHLEQKEKNFIIRVLKSYLFINAVIGVVGLTALIYFSNQFYSSWKQKNDDFKNHMLSSIGKDDEFTKAFNNQKAILSDFMEEERQDFRKRHNEAMKGSDKQS